MKKIAVILSLFALVFLVLFIIIDQDRQNLNIVYVDNLVGEEAVTVKVCVRRPDSKLALIDVEKHTDEDELIYILKIYDHYRNALPPRYTTPLVGNFEILKFEKTNDTLVIELKAMYLKEGLSDFLTALMWSYQYRGIAAVDIKINKEQFRIEKNRAINPEIETPYGNVTQTIFYREGDEILPVTYIHKENRVDFLLKKIISKYPGASYEYAAEGELLMIRITDPDYQISKDITDMLLLSIDNLGIYDNIVIIKNGDVVANN